MFLGSKEAYAAHQRSCPSCYYYTPGWNRARRVPCLQGHAVTICDRINQQQNYAAQFSRRSAATF